MATPRRRRWSRPAAEAGLVMVALLLMLAAATGGFLVGRETADDDGGETAAAETTASTSESASTATETEATTSEAATTEAAATTGEAEGGEDADGKAVFAKAGCGSCHTFGPAGSKGTVGPNLNRIDLSKDEIEDQVRNGGGGMPPFKDQLSDGEIEAVADFVEHGSGG